MLNNSNLRLGWATQNWTAWINDKMLKDLPYLDYFLIFLSYFFRTESYLAFGLFLAGLSNFASALFIAYFHTYAIYLLRAWQK